MNRHELIKAIVTEMAEWNYDALLSWAQATQGYALSQRTMEDLEWIYDRLDKLSAEIEG